VPPLVLALIEAVFALAYHHDERARRSSGDQGSLTVRAEIRGPELDEPAPGGLAVRVIVSSSTSSEIDTTAEIREEAVVFHVDLRLERLLALELGLAELPLDRSGFALLLGELETWCYTRIPATPLVSDAATED
jgi:hypothetical protein